MPNPEHSPKPVLLIRLTHTGFLADGRINNNPVLINDLDVGYENQNRKVACYVPVGGHIDIPGSSRSLLSFDSGTIRKFHQVGVITAQMFVVPEGYTTIGRPSASEYPNGTYTWNETEHAPNFAEGSTWVSLAGGGPPGPHATSHATGGLDPITVGSTIAINNLGTTGITVNSYAGALSVTDPGHIHGLTDPGHSHSVSTATATNNANTTGMAVVSGTASVSITDPSHSHTLSNATPAIGSILMSGWYSINSVESSGLSQGTIAQNSASATPTNQPGVPRPMDVVFPSNWIGGTVTVNGIGRGGTVVSETFTFPPGGGTVEGSKPLITLTSFTNSAPAGGGGVLATVQLHDSYAVPEENVVQFLKVSIDGQADSFATADTVNGTFEPVGNHHGNHGMDVWYTYSINPVQVAHTHTVNANTTGITASDSGHTHNITDPGHTHTQNGHSHAAGVGTTGATVSSHISGVSVNDPGHTHNITDTGHTHTQTGHSHSLSG